MQASETFAWSITYLKNILPIFTISIVNMRH